jgi:hypothetical protein
MGTFTSRLALFKPDPTPVTGDLVDALVDLNQNWDKIDAAGTIAAVCTSTTRPSTPVVGTMAYETDTKADIICTSTGPAVWRYLSIPQVTSITTTFAGANAPIVDQLALQTSDHKMYRWTGTIWMPQQNGRIASTSLLSGTGVTTSELLQPETISAPVILNRHYNLRHSRNEAFSGSANNRTNKFRVSSGTLTVSSTQIESNFVNGLTGGYNTFQCEVDWVATFTGTATFGLSSIVNTAAGLVDNVRARLLTLTDVTPTW